MINIVQKLLGKLNLKINLVVAFSMVKMPLWMPICSTECLGLSYSSTTEPNFLILCNLKNSGDSSWVPASQLAVASGCWLRPDPVLNFVSIWKNTNRQAISDSLFAFQIYNKKYQQRGPPALRHSG